MENWGLWTEARGPRVLRAAWMRAKERTWQPLEHVTGIIATQDHVCGQQSASVDGLARGHIRGCARHFDLVECPPAGSTTCCDAKCSGVLSNGRCCYSSMLARGGVLKARHHHPMNGRTGEQEMGSHDLPLFPCALTSCVSLPLPGMGAKK